MSNNPTRKKNRHVKAEKHYQLLEIVRSALCKVKVVEEWVDALGILVVHWAN